MTPEQASKLRKGDEVLVRCVITGTDLAPEPNGVLVRAAHDPHGHNLYVRTEAIREVLPRPLEAGDRVRLPNPMFHQVGVLLAIDGEECWVRWDDGVRNTQDLSDLQRVDDEDRKAKEG